MTRRGSTFILLTEPTIAHIVMAHLRRSHETRAERGKAKSLLARECMDKISRGGAESAEKEQGKVDYP